MKNAMEYINGAKSLEEALGRAHRDAIYDIATDLRCMDERELYVDVFKTYDEDLVHTMDELDDVYSCLTVTEILDQLRDIDIRDEYFNEQTCESGDDIWEVAGMTPESIAEWILDDNGLEEYDNAGFYELIYDYEMVCEKIHAYFERINVAKKLFEQRLLNDGVEAVISTLWNM